MPQLDVASSYDINMNRLRRDQIRSNWRAEQDDSDEKNFKFDPVKLSTNSGIPGKKNKKKDNKKKKRSKTSRSPHRQHGPSIEDELVKGM